MPMLQVYKDHSMIDPGCVELMCAACDHPHAAEAFLSIFLSPRGRVGVGVMVKELCEQGIPVCQMHGMSHCLFSCFRSSLK